MRCWVGTELENNLNYGNKTLFVEANIVHTASLIQLLTRLDDESYNITSVYFGAGEVPLYKLALTDKQYKFLKNYFIIIECEPQHLQFILDRYQYIADNIVVSHRIPEDSQQVQLSKISVKFRTFDTVEIRNQNKAEFITDLSTLNNGLFSDVDKLVYDDTTY